MVVSNDTLWFSSCLKDELPYSEPLIDLIDQISKSGFSRSFPSSLLHRIAHPADLPKPDSPVDLNQLLTTFGDGELNVFVTIIGYSQVPRLIESAGRNKHYVPLLDAILQRVAVRLDLERQSHEHQPLFDFLKADVDLFRDLLFIYYDSDCGSKWTMTKELKSSLRTAVLRIFNRYHLCTVKEGKHISDSSVYVPSQCYSLLAALGDFVAFQAPFKDGMSVEQRLDIVYRSPLSDAMLRYLPSETEVKQFVSRSSHSNSLRKKDPFVLDPIDIDGSFGSALRIMTHASSSAWVCAPCIEFPTSMQQYTVKQQRVHAYKLRKLGKKANDIMNVLKVNEGVDSRNPNLPHPGMLQGTRSSWLGRLRFRLAACTLMGTRSANSRRLAKLKQVNRQIAAVGLGLESETWIEELGIAGMFKELRAFSERIAKEAPEISNTYGEKQAVRNLWACFGLETILFHQNPSSNDAIFGYCMLYPKTDNFLDSNDVSRESKVAFQHAFHKRIRGDPTPDIKEDPSLKTVLDDVSDMIGLIEGYWPRRDHSSLYVSAIALNKAQTVSLKYQQTLQSDRKQVLEVSLYKGGISVMTDAFLVRGNITMREAGFSFVLGTCLQMMDDLQDVLEDMSNSQSTPFTPTSISHPQKDSRLADQNGVRLFWFLSQIWSSQERGGDGERSETVLQRSASAQRNEVVVKTCLRLSQMMALKALFRGQAVFTKEFLRTASERCTLEPDAMLQLHGITFLHKMAKLDYI